MKYEGQTYSFVSSSALDDSKNDGSDEDCTKQKAVDPGEGNEGIDSHAVALSYEARREGEVSGRRVVDFWGKLTSELPGDRSLVSTTARRVFQDGGVLSPSDSST